MSFYEILIFVRQTVKYSLKLKILKIWPHPRIRLKLKPISVTKFFFETMDCLFRNIFGHPAEFVSLNMTILPRLNCG